MVAGQRSANTQLNEIESEVQMRCSPRTLEQGVLYPRQAYWGPVEIRLTAIERDRAKGRQVGIKRNEGYNV